MQIRGMKMKTSKKGIDLTEGPIAKQIILFAVPLFLSSLIQQLYNTVDLIFVGQCLDTDATAAVGASSMLITLMIGFFNGLSIGIGIIMAKAFGSGNKKRMQEVIHNAAGLSVAGAFILMVIGWIFSPAILKLMNTPERILELGAVYLRYYFICMGSVICFNSAAGILRALGNSRSPMICQLIGGVANVIGDFFFIYVFGMGVKGVALATLFSQTCACIVTVWHLFRLDAEYRLQVKQICIKKELTKEILAVGLPSGIQSMIITFSNMIIQSQINTLGVESIAAFTAYYRVETLIYNPIVAFGQAASTCVSQNTGARKLQRTKEGTKATIKTGVLITLVISFTVIWFSDFFFGMFTKDPQVIAIGSKMARVSYPFYFIYVFLEVFAASTRGAGKAVPPMVITIVNMCIVRTLLLVIIMHFSPCAQHLVAVYPMTWAVTAFCQYFYYRTGQWVPEDMRNQMKKEVQSDLL